MIEEAKIVRLEPRHAAIVPYLREADREEIRVSSEVSVEMAVAYSIVASTPGWAVELNGKPVVVFGARDTGGGRGEPWLVATDVIEQYPVHFYRISRDYIRQLRERYSLLENWTDARNVLSVRWLRWAGFIIEKAEPWGVKGFGFHKFWWEDKFDKARE